MAFLGTYQVEHLLAASFSILILSFINVIMKLNLLEMPQEFAKQMGNGVENFQFVKVCHAGENDVGDLFSHG